MILIFQQLQNGAGYGIIIVISTLVVGSSNLFLFCYFGKSATDSFHNISNILFESNWPDIPVHLQRYFILLILNTNKPPKYHGFGIVDLDLETFQRVKK